MLHTKNKLLNTENLISLKLDTSQDELLVANTLMTILLVYISLLGYIVSIFGMNLDNYNYINSYKNYNIFIVVICISLFILIIGFPISWSYYIVYEVIPQRVRMNIKK
mmetsp:Transcript_13982/g.14075  ORF Transcript_13982/g.14075 Transcript_13982/m.14075 type:complete len:108 (+) Transcript_13982:96-419(+)